MSESLLYDLSQQLRLLARRNCRLNGSGTLVNGNVDQSVEAARLRLLDILEHFQDYHVLEVDALDTISFCQALAWQNHDRITALRREAEFEQRLETSAPRPLRLEAA
jgi:calcineurin-like phosphoesterase family protein